MRELALFAGAGGGLLGGTLLGWRPVCAVELDPYCRSVLLARQRDGLLPPFPIWDDVRTFDGRPWRGSVDVISGGFPCQDISSAGTRVGITGSRSGLWSEFARIISEVRPCYALIENSADLITRGLGTVLSDLAALGYHARWDVLGACHAGAPHRRERVWIVAYANSQHGHARLGLCERAQPQTAECPDASDRHVRASSPWLQAPASDYRMADGLASSVDRIRAAGNGQVPRVAALAFHLLSNDLQQHMEAYGKARALETEAQKPE